MAAPFVAHVARNPHAFLDPDSFPGNLPFTRDLNLIDRHAALPDHARHPAQSRSLLEAPA